MKYVIADDLTGANDTGVQFAKRGYTTMVSILEDDFLKTAIPSNLDVFVIDTETRELKSEKSKEKIKNILQKLNIGKGDLVYKKVDSTLRGNIGNEIEEIMNILKKDICIFSPSFPSHQRITVGGYLIVKQKPLGLSEYSSNNLDKSVNSYIPLLLQKQTDLSIARIGLRDVIRGQKIILNKIKDLYKKGNKIIVIDSTDEKHLKDIYFSSIKFGGSVLLSGSAGLANHFQSSYNKLTKIKVKIENNEGPILVIAGSRNSILEKQIKYLKNRINFTELIIDIEKIFSNKEKILSDYMDIGSKSIKMNHVLVVHTNAFSDESKLVSKKIISKYNISFRELEIKIKTFLGEFTSGVLKDYSFGNLILTGGDIALGVCKELDISNLVIKDEMLPGIPLSLACNENIQLNIMTKAGGFGKEDTLYHLINKLKN